MDDNKIDVLKQRDYKVVKSNQIIQKAKYDLNITELKTLAYILSKIKPGDKELQEYTFSVKEYSQVAGLDYKNGAIYQHIKKTLKALRDKSFWMIDDAGNDVLIGWLSKVRINKGSGKIIVRLDEEIQKHVLSLFDNFTQYELISILPMKSNYSVRIYELLKSYAFIKEHTFEIDELKKLLAATNYTNFKDFRKYVLEIAVKEINRYTDLEVSWEPQKKGKKVIKVKFTIDSKPPWEIYESKNRANEQIEGQISLLDYEYYK